MGINKKSKIIVCGVGFGNFYLRALSAFSKDIELAGILSRGSAESKRYAQKYQVPLYTETDQLPKDIYAACVVVKTEVMGGSGEKIAVELMRKGIHVLLEHPIHYRNLINCYREAASHNVFFKTGDLYLQLECVRELDQFIKCRKSEILEISMECSARVLFPLLHCLVHLDLNLGPLVLSQSHEFLGINQIITGTMGAIPFELKINNEVDKKNPESYMRMFFSLEAVMESGRVVLQDIHGPLIYYPVFYLPFDKNSAVSIQDDFGAVSMQNNQHIGSGKVHLYDQIFNNIWPSAIKQDIQDFISVIKQGLNNHIYTTENQKNLLAAQYWQELSK